MPTGGVERALGEDPAERGRELLRLREDQWFDRKSKRVRARDLADAEIGLANAEGGTLVIGLSDGAVEGIDDVPKRLNEWQQVPLAFTSPPVPAHHRVVECVDDRGGTNHLLVVDVEPSQLVHANQRDDVYLRIGDTNRRLTFSQRQALMYDKGQAAFELTTVPNIGTEDLDDDLIADYASALGHPDPMRLLVARGLVTTYSEVTVAGYLLFGDEPEKVYPEASVRVLRYIGSERGTGARQQLADDLRLEGPIPQVLQDAEREIFQRIPTRVALGARGRFEPVGIVPHDAWLEGVVNAVIHRSYSTMGDHVRVEIFNDRIEIESPGRFPGVVDLSQPLAITRFARNPRIARVCADLRFGQELGEGIRRMFEEMRLAGLADPEYRQTSGSVRLTLSSGPVDRQLEARLPRGSRELVRAIREAGRASTGDLVEATGLSRPVVLRRLSALRETGIIEWVGNAKQDPRAFWRLSVE